MEDQSRIKHIGCKTNNGKVYFASGFNLTPWQLAKSLEVTVSIEISSYQKYQIYVFEINSSDLDEFEKVVKSEEIDILKENDESTVVG